MPPGAFLVGFATSIKVLMEMGNIGDTISYQLSTMLEGLPLYVAAMECLSHKPLLILYSLSGQACHFACDATFRRIT